ncbi:uncharacterized protein LOC117119783 [Anneissia japonica]|uniref:uncharacterized protein LOC117119783 n=1 Tax=Anneissia japonica TaxID=1529436 RepID=UPI0014259E67|nr:uncharacterized protein LOC117119783 [Anneissia japonica]
MNETIDIHELGKLITIVTEHQFYKDCGHYVTALINGIVGRNNDTDGKKLHTYKSFIQSHSNISVPKVLANGNNLFGLKHVLPTFNTNVQDNFDRCLGYIYPYGDSAQLFLGRQELRSLIFKHLRRPDLIKKHQQSISKSLWKSGGVLGVHWRLNKEWQRVWCRGNDSYSQKYACKVARIDKAFIAKRLVNTMTMLNLSNIYLASTQDSEKQIISLEVLYHHGQIMSFGKEITNRRQLFQRYCCHHYKKLEEHSGYLVDLNINVRTVAITVVFHRRIYFTLQKLQTTKIC